MPAKNPRISAVVDVGLWKWLRSMAKGKGISVSLVVRDILMRVRAEEEEQYWASYLATYPVSTRLYESGCGSRSSEN